MYMYSRSLITLKKSVITIEVLIQLSEVIVIKKLQCSELMNMFSKYSIYRSEVHVLKELQYCEVKYMY